MKFADLHCHNHMRPYFWLARKKRKFTRKGMYTPWTVISSNLKNLRNGKMTASYSQCDLVKSWNGKVRLTFNSLYPIEKGFFQTPSQPSKGRNKLFRQIVRVATSHQLPIRDLLQTIYMKIPDIAVDHFQSPEYDYWEAINEEVKFMLTSNGKSTSNKIYTPGLIRQIFESRRNRRRLYPDSMDAKGSYYIPNDREELKNSLQKDQITMVITIEGAHALGTDNVPFATFKKRVATIKKEWPFPVFFITFAHHFDNGLCGHAHSIPDIGKWLLNQSPRKNEGFSPEGRKIIRRFLSINTNNHSEPKWGYRILIDVKHMSARARREYYHDIIIPCMEAEDKETIPVIASHCGFSGIKDLNTHIEKEALEKDDYFDPSGFFNAWNINMCEEDLKIIVQSSGLFGLSFDQRIIGVPGLANNTPNNIRGLWNNIKAVIKSIYNRNDLAEKEKNNIWNCITIGTDFEGLINPVDDYPTVLNFEDFEQNLIEIIEQERRDNRGNLDFMAHIQSKADVTKAVRNFCFENAKTFVLKHYPRHPLH
ncbi:membrane dipeptidase [Echinicola jeungdonensis]|uniref:Membrane dipeptidase n=1 Tax=Echinicola jeungdonensis TaxID=709343 RepID=A0ABV5J5Q3_9BACT|nr:membrane dipeptidase [Echinicola jeungdonensis]MDN3670061.1 membrane dipeptidase [Echinicola jeungdonensis]